VPITGQIQHPIVDALSLRPVLHAAHDSAQVRTPGSRGKRSQPGRDRDADPPPPSPGVGRVRSRQHRSQRPILDQGKDTEGRTSSWGSRSPSVKSRAKPGGRSRGWSSSPAAPWAMISGSRTSRRTRRPDEFGELAPRPPEMQGIAPKTHVALTLTADPVLRTRLVLVPTVGRRLDDRLARNHHYAARRE